MIKKMIVLRRDRDDCCFYHIHKYTIKKDLTTHEYRFSIIIS